MTTNKDKPLDELLSELDALLAKASKLPWVADGDALSWTEDGYGTNWVMTPNGAWRPTQADTADDMLRTLNDSRLIVAAVNALPRLLSELRRLQAELAEQPELPRWPCSCQDGECSATKLNEQFFCRAKKEPAK